MYNALRQIVCIFCKKPCSTVTPDGFVFRAGAICPECVERIPEEFFEGVFPERNTEGAPAVRAGEPNPGVRTSEPATDSEGVAPAAAQAGGQDVRPSEPAGSTNEGPGEDAAFPEHSAPPARVQCTGVSAAWCPIHGDCTCPEINADGERDMNDGDCPLHSASSDHAETTEEGPGEGRIPDDPGPLGSVPSESASAPPKCAACNDTGYRGHGSGVPGVIGFSMTRCHCKVAEDFLGRSPGRVLEVEVEDGQIIIRFPLACLRLAMAGAIELGTVPAGWLVAWGDKLASDMVAELSREDDEGTTPVHRLLDAAMTEAIEAGSTGVVRCDPECARCFGVGLPDRSKPRDLCDCVKDLS